MGFACGGFLSLATTLLHGFRLWRVSFFGNNLVARVSPVASFFLLLRQKKETKDKTAKRFWTALAGPEGIKPKVLQKATPDRSKVRNKIDILRRLRNSQFASVELLKQGVLGHRVIKPQTINFKAARFTGRKSGLLPNLC
jgi:hypothetical protein